LFLFSETHSIARRADIGTDSRVKGLAQHQWLRLVILATQEAELRRIIV
jgi:hypothetical protein